MEELVCQWCAQPLRWEPRRGWVHPEGGLYVMVCASCGWRGAPYPSPACCPQCGGEVLDDHCARPIRLSDLRHVPPRDLPRWRKR